MALDDTYLEGGKKVRVRTLARRKGLKKAKRGKFAHSQYAGVRQRSRGKWAAEIYDQRKKTRIWLGTYVTEVSAALAYDNAARNMYGSSAWVNLPDGSTSTTTGTNLTMKNFQPRLEVGKQTMEEKSVKQIGSPIAVAETDSLKQISSPIAVAETDSLQQISSPIAVVETDSLDEQSPEESCNSSEQFGRPVTALALEIPEQESLQQFHEEDSEEDFQAVGCWNEIMDTLSDRPNFLNPDNAEATLFPRSEIICAVDLQSIHNMDGDITRYMPERTLCGQQQSPTSSAPTSTGRNVSKSVPYRHGVESEMSLDKCKEKISHDDALRSVFSSFAEDQNDTIDDSGEKQMLAVAFTDPVLDDIANSPASLEEICTIMFGDNTKLCQIPNVDFEECIELAIDDCGSLWNFE